MGTSNFFVLRMKIVALLLRFSCYTENKKIKHMDISWQNNIDILYACQMFPEMTNMGIMEHIRRFHSDVQRYVLQNGEDFSLIKMDWKRGKSYERRLDKLHSNTIYL